MQPRVCKSAIKALAGWTTRLPPSQSFPVTQVILVLFDIPGHPVLYFMGFTYNPRFVEAVCHACISVDAIVVVDKILVHVQRRNPLALTEDFDWFRQFVQPFWGYIHHRGAGSLAQEAPVAEFLMRQFEMVTSRRIMKGLLTPKEIIEVSRRVHVTVVWKISIRIVESHVPRQLLRRSQAIRRLQRLVSSMGRHAGRLETMWYFQLRSDRA